MKPGLYSGIPADQYHAAEGISQSHLKLLWERSPAHMIHQIKHPPPPTEAQRLGAAIHDAVLLPDEFPVRWALGGSVCEGERQDGTPCAKQGSARVGGRWYCHLHQPSAEPDSVTVLRPEQVNLVVRVRSALAEHPLAQRFLSGAPERSAWWTDEATGTLCKGRFDLLSDVKPVIVDLKTTKNAAPESFARDVNRFGYHIQAAHYLAGAAALDLDAERFLVVAVEKEPPHGIALYEIGEEWLRPARVILRNLLDRFAWCRERDEWPGYPETVTFLEPPVWAERELEWIVQHGGNDVHI